LFKGVIIDWMLLLSRLGGGVIVEERQEYVTRALYHSVVDRLENLVYVLLLVSVVEF
jgi:hypothetical protein